MRLQSSAASCLTWRPNGPLLTLRPLRARDNGLRIPRLVRFIRFPLGFNLSAV